VATPETKFIKLEEVNLDPVKIYDEKGRGSSRCLTCGRAGFNNGNVVSHVNAPTEELQLAPENGGAADLESMAAQCGNELKVKAERVEGIWRCGRCDMTFSSEYFKRKHARKVHGRKNWKCDECGGNYPSEKELERHRKHGKCMKRIFEDRKKCKFCGKKLSRADSAKRHLKICSKKAKERNGEQRRGVV